MRCVPVAGSAAEENTVGVDVDLDAVTLDLARALATPAVGRFVASGVVSVVVADACGRVAGLAGFGAGEVALAERLLDGWRDELAAAKARLGGADAAVREVWLGVAGAALALSAVAGGLGAEPIGAEEGELLGAAMLSHAVGVLYVQAELGRLWADPLGELERRRACAAALLRAAEAAIASGSDRGPWLWLELEEAAARAAAAAAIVSLEIA